MQECFKVVCIGETLWDMFSDGAKFGGAPANVACHCASLLNEAYMISCIGNDDYGKKAIEFLKKRNVNVDGIAVSDKYSTGTVRVTVDKHGKPEYVIEHGVAWDNIVCTERLKTIAKNADVICFGSLAQRDEISKKTIYDLLDVSASSCLKVFDVNLRQNHYSEKNLQDSISRADILKLNDEELPVIAGIFGLSGDERELAKSLIRACNLKLVAITRGENGALLVSPYAESDFPGIKVDNVIDTVGAGDSFTAALVSGLLKNKLLDEINRNACKIAAYVCSKPGATPELP